MKFIHTADWQIGMKATGMGKAATVVRDSRIHSIENIFDIAEKNNADFILVCGDVFEDNQVSIETIKKVVTIFNKHPEMPIYLLPGNHDYLGPGSVYKQSIFSKVKNLVIFRDSKPVQHNEVTIFPAPININRRAEDPTSCIPDTSSCDGVKIGASHGSYEGSFYSEQKIEFPISNSCIERTGLDYLALGHHHNRNIFDVNGVSRVAYSGTHEQTSFDETSSGYSLLVEISPDKKIPQITPVKTGILDWELVGFSLSDELSVTNFSEILNKLKRKPILKLRLDGKLPFNLKENIDKLIEFHDTQHSLLKVETDIEYVIPTDISEIIEINDPIVKRTAEILRSKIENENDLKKHDMLVNCLGCLYQTVKEASQ